MWGGWRLALIAAAMTWGTSARAQDFPVDDLRRTGEIAPPQLEATGTTIKPGAVGERPELSPPDPEDVTTEGRVLARDRIDPDEVLGPALSTEIDRLRSCQPETAAEQRAAVRAGTVELRFVVAADGGVSDTEVVALSPTHPEVLECVQRRMADWRFLNTAGKPFDVQRRYTFPR